MHRTTPILLIALTAVFCTSAPAFECTNAGAGTTAPNDGDIASRTACGDGAVAAGGNGTAVGGLASAAGNSSTAIGQLASAAGAGGTALGREASASGSSGTALGNSASASQSSSIAVGYNADAPGIHGTGVGSWTSADGTSSVALGYAASAIGHYSTALGYQAYASGLSSTAVGFGAYGSFENSAAIGFRARAGQANAMVLGSIPDVNLGEAYVDIGIGTTTPDVPLHLYRDDGTAGILVEENSVAAAARTLFTLSNPGNTKFEIIESNSGNSWAFTNSGADFRVSLQGSGVVEFRIDNNGDAFLAGLLQENSDRDAKTNIQPVDAEVVLNKVTRLPIAEWAYTETPDSRHIGPMAQDFHAAFGTGRSDRMLATMDVGGVAIASIQALARQNAELARQNAQLTARNDELERRLDALEVLVTGQAAAVARRGQL